jgi:hypothetical protein
MISTSMPSENPPLPILDAFAIENSASAQAATTAFAGQMVTAGLSDE